LITFTILTGITEVIPVKMSDLVTIVFYDRFCERSITEPRSKIAALSNYFSCLVDGHFREAGQNTIRIEVRNANYFVLKLLEKIDLEDQDSTMEKELDLLEDSSYFGITYNLSKLKITKEILNEIMEIIKRTGDHNLIQKVLNDVPAHVLLHTVSLDALFMIAKNGKSSVPRTIGMVNDNDNETVELKMKRCLILYLYNHKLPTNAVDVAIQLNDKDLIKWTAEKLGLLQVCQAIASHGNLDLLVWAIQLFPWDGQVCVTAAENGHFHLVKWIIENDHVISHNDVVQCVSHIIDYNKLDMLEYFCDKYPDIHDDIALIAARSDNIKILEWADQNGWSIETTQIYNVAYVAMHINILFWVHKKDPTLTISLDELVYAAMCNNFQALKWLDEQIRTRYKIYPTNSKICYYAVINGNAEMLRWALNKGYSHNLHNNQILFLVAACTGHLDVVKILHNFDNPVNKKFCINVTKYGHLEIIKWAHTINKKIWSHNITRIAARNGHLELLKWALENGCPWDKQMASQAAAGGQLKVLIWARNHGYCPWSCDICHEAAIYGHLEVLKWAKSQNCPWDKAKCSCYVYRKYGMQSEIYQWIDNYHRQKIEKTTH